MNINRFSIVLIIVMSIVFMINQPVNGREIPVGKIDKIQGPVTILRSDGQEIMGKERLPLFPGDEITTSKDGMIWFSLQQGQQFRLGSNAQMSVGELSGSEVEDGHPIMRLVLGYLWSKVQKIKKICRVEIHTPTAVLGVRGTEFDTVVSLDASSIITVDKGTIEVDAEAEKIILDEGKMTQVELDIKPTPPLPAIPKEKRDWHAWRTKKITLLFKKLPHMAPRLRKRFERAANRFIRFTTNVKKASDKLETAMGKVRQAKLDRDRQKFVQSVRQLKARVRRFKKMVVYFRGGLNRVRVMGKISYRIEQSVTKNKNRFSKQNLTTIESNFGVISQKRMQLKDISRQTIITIRQTFKHLKELRQEIRGI